MNTQTQSFYSRADYLNNKCTHEQYYGQYIGVGMQNLIVRRLGRDRLEKAFAEDENLNTIPLHIWDVLINFLPLGIREEMRKRGDYLTMAGNACLWKCAAKKAIQ